METKGKHIIVKFISKGIYQINSIDENFCLGNIEWYYPWKEYIWKQSDEAIMSESCLKEAFKIVKEMYKQSQEMKNE